MKHKPIVSVIMPVYNAEAYVGEAIESILAQTYIDIDFIIINDGSVDSTADIVESYADSRIRYYANDMNRGIVYTLNRGLSLAKGEYIARMDSDDVSLPERLAQQVAYMEKHPRVVACGTLYGLYGKVDSNPIDVAVSAQDIRVDMALYCQFAHSMVMIRKSVLDEHHLHYREDYKYAEDYKLWTELLQYGDMVNIPKVLGYIRQCDDGISIVHAEKQKRLSDRVRLEYLQYMGIYPSVLLNNIDNENKNISIIKDVLCAYKPLIKRCSNHTWLYRNYRSILKRYLRGVPMRERVREMISQYGDILTIRDKITIMVR